MISKQIADGIAVLKRIRKIPLREIRDTGGGELVLWDDYNTTLLSTIFKDRLFLTRYVRHSKPTYRQYSDIAAYYTALERWYKLKQRELESIKKQLPLLGKAPIIVSTQPKQMTSFGKRVFIVHGHNETIKLSTARFLEKMGVDIVILHEQPNKGMTLIEKLEANSAEADIGYAVILLMPDDIGKLEMDKGELQPRARQNVVFELGYFTGKLGRERVCALYNKGTELPSDYEGIVYVELDDAGAWQLKLAQELMAVGYDIDLNKVIK